MKKSPVLRFKTSIRNFIQQESSSGIFLLLSVILAILWANSSFYEAYEQLWHVNFTVGIEGFNLSYPLHNWINDGLMAVFFFVIGLELKREFLEGALSTAKKAALPLGAALGGMLLPALLYLSFNYGSAAQSGWGIPMATDIAFALALLSMAGKNVPLAVKVFLSALAVADDLGAVVVIALFYTASINFLALGIGGVFLIILLLGNKFGIKAGWYYVLLGCCVWVCFLQSGVHATIAGVLIAFTIPHTTSKMNQVSLLYKLEHGLHKWVAFGIMPIFALANAGIIIGADFLSNLANPVSGGIILGLVVGKFIGILLFCWLMIRFGWANLPDQVSWNHLTGVALLAGVGFTMSLFITGLAFKDQQFVDQAKYGIIIASIIAGLAGTLVLKRVAK